MKIVISFAKVFENFIRYILKDVIVFVYNTDNIVSETDTGWKGMPWV